VDYPSNFVAATIKKETTVKELQEIAKKALKINDLGSYSISSVSYLNDVIVLDGKFDSKVEELGIGNESVVFFLAPEALKPKVKRKIPKKEEKESEPEDDFEERYKGLTAENALTKLAAAKRPKERTIVLEYIDMFAKPILANPEKLKLETLKLILKSDTLNLPEGDIFDVVVKWGTAELKKQKKEKKELKSLLETTGLFHLVRLPCMDMADVAAKVTPAGVLGDTQMLDLYTFLSAKVTGAKVPLPASLKLFNAKQREGREDRDTSWMLTEDTFKGFKPVSSPSGVTRFWLCVSKATSFDSKAKYDPPRGYVWATSEMWNSNTVFASNSDYNYYNQGGWSGYTFAGQTRYYFAFKDVVTTNRALHAGNYATMASYSTWNPISSPTNFAGIVVIKVGSWDTVSKTFKA